uniref:Nucleobase-ascorbate transporter 4-like n=1 Tax=Tanacetum cinerariifolium TaxID=118510 RepID=A0A6L2JPK1_TANCI|nr:nucleobase-ascorbate transporter 4-like [Tanacetum cinerariifolium]
MLVIFTSLATAAGIVSMFLDRTLGYGDKDIRIDGGRQWWGKLSALKEMLEVLNSTCFLMDFLKYILSKIASAP